MRQTGSDALDVVMKALEKGMVEQQEKKNFVRAAAMLLVARIILWGTLQFIRLYLWLLGHKGHVPGVDE
jgi:hypothetical protein